MTERPIPAGNQCEICLGLLGPIENAEHTRHPFCGWATEEDWRALRPYLTKNMGGVYMSGC